MLTEHPETGKRVYLTPEGNYYPSVTTFLGELPNKALINWKKRVGEEQATKISKSATGRGSYLHECIEHYLLNNQQPFANELQQRLFIQLKSTLDSIDNIRVIEKALYSNKLKLAGTPDCIADYGGDLSVIDFKTSTKIKQEKWIHGYFCQTAAYAIMFEELYGIKPLKSVIIMAIEEANIPQVFVKDIEESIYMLKEYASKLLIYRNGG